MWNRAGSVLVRSADLALGNCRGAVVEPLGAAIDLGLADEYLRGAVDVLGEAPVQCGVGNAVHLKHVLPCVCGRN